LEAMAGAHARWNRLGAEPWREAWVLRVALNEALGGPPTKRWRPAPDPSAAVDHADDVVVRQTLRAALQALPRRQREVVVLRHLVGLSEPEVALGARHQPGEREDPPAPRPLAFAQGRRS
jgi:DNA-directed RNA polymerase specialized sigma24 family protein